MDGTITIGTEIDTKSFDKQIVELEQQLERLEKERQLFSKAGSKEDLQYVKEIDSQIEKISNRIVDLRQKQQDLYTHGGFEGINDSLTGILRKVGKWTLAIFGIRSAYSLITRSMSTLSQYDDNMSNQLEYMRWTIANAIAPVVRWIISAVYLIMQYINQITKSLFGWDLFKGPREFSKQMKSASGSAKQIQKSLAGFDEMNILGDNTTASGGVGGGMPSFDTDNVIVSLEKFKRKIADIGKSFREMTDDMEKRLEDRSSFTKAYGNWDWLMSGVVRAMYGVNKSLLGWIDTFKGVFTIIKGVVKGDTDLIAKGIEITFNGIKERITGTINNILSVFEIVTGTIKGTLQTLTTWLSTTFLSKMRELFGPIGSIIAYPIISAITSLKTWFTDLGNGIIKVFNGVLKFIKGDFKGGFQSSFSGLKDILLAPFRAMRDAINSIIKGLNKIKIPKGIPGIGGISINIPTIPKLAKGTILNNPGRGVPVASGSAIGGEAGREAYIPLSDTQLLQELGSTIGRYITIDLTNVTQLDGTTIAKQFNNINYDNDFLRNR